MTDPKTISDDAIDRKTHTERINRLERKYDSMRGELSALEKQSMSINEKVDHLVTSSAVMAQAMKHIEQSVACIPSLTERQTETDARSRLAVWVMGILFIAYTTAQVTGLLQKNEQPEINVIMPGDLGQK